MFASIVIAQTNNDSEKSRIAVYLTASENVDSEVKRVISNQIINALQRTGSYSLIERNEAFVAQIDKERGVQQSGRVLDNQITRLGREFGAVAVCIVDVGSFMGELSVDMRMVEVEKTTVIHSGHADGRFSGLSDIRTIVDKAAANMLEVSSGGRPSGGTTGGSSGSRRNGEVYNPDGIELVYVEGTGSGIMAMKGFYIGKFEVTQAQWQAIMGNNPSNFKGAGNLPVESVSWNDVQEFLARLNRATGRNYRLPTEAEWEFAARGGTAEKFCPGGCEYSGSNNINSVAWFTDNSSSRTQPVGTKAPNELGIHDMSGNVWEWCRDWFDANYYGSSPVESPTGPSSGSYRGSRGGSWNDTARGCRVSNRLFSTPEFRISYLGLRLLLP